ncbi:MAG: 4Fe-4S binding protein, partial [Aeromonas sp.]
SATRKVAPSKVLGWLCLLLLILPLLSYGLLNIWVSHTPLAVRAALLQLLPTLTH